MILYITIKCSLINHGYKIGNISSITDASIHYQNVLCIYDLPTYKLIILLCVHIVKKSDNIILKTY